jgi:hypothetical protein
MLQSAAIGLTNNSRRKPEPSVDKLGTIQLNKNATTEFRRLSTGQTIAVVDDFLAAPDELRTYAAAQANRFFTPEKSYPGVLLDIDAQPMTDVYRFIRFELGPRFLFLRGGAQFSSMLSMTTLQPDQLSNLQRLCHSDPPAKRTRANFAFVLYLFKNEQLGGTGLYRWKEREAITKATALENEDPEKALAFLKERFPTFNEPPCYITQSTEIAEQLDVVPARYNRLTFYSGDIPHSAQILSPELLSTDVSDGRLTLNCFASVRPKY